MQFLGIHNSPDGQFIVTEFLSKGKSVQFLHSISGSLLNFLVEYKDKLSVGDLTQILSEAACGKQSIKVTQSGMAYLEQKSIVHRDLSARNLLVEEVSGKYTIKGAYFQEIV